MSKNRERSPRERGRTPAGPGARSAPQKESLGFSSGASRGGGPPSAPQSAQTARDYVERFSLNQRIQHITAMISILVLCVTGLALRYHDTWFGRTMISIEGGFEARGILHRIAALVLVGLAAYHILYLLFSDRGHSDLRKIAPSLRDFSNLRGVIGQSLLGGKERRLFVGKFNLRQKIQYFGVTLGSALMIVTGFVLWFETQAMALMPKWMVDLTAIVHGAEGLLIFVIILLWHFYNVHLNPESFPMNRTWLTGRMSVKELRDRHPLEYEREFGERLGGGGA
jgi:formate dehydrogenase subunit gamma